MFSKQKKGRSYMNLAVFGLAAAGLATIAHKAKKFMKEKASCMCDFFKKNMD